MFSIDPVCSETLDLDDISAILDEAVAFGLGHVAGDGYDERDPGLTAGLGIVEKLVGQDTGTDKVDILIIGFGIVHSSAGEEGDECVFRFRRAGQWWGGPDVGGRSRGFGGCIGSKVL